MLASARRRTPAGHLTPPEIEANPYRTPSRRRCTQAAITAAAVSISFCCVGGVQRQPQGAGLGRGSGQGPAAHGWVPPHRRNRQNPRKRRSPFRPKAAAGFSASTPSKVMFTLPGRRWAASPFRWVPGMASSRSVRRWRKSGSGPGRRRLASAWASAAASARDGRYVLGASTVAALRPPPYSILQGDAAPGVQRTGPFARGTCGRKG